MQPKLRTTSLKGVGNASRDGLSIAEFSHSLKLGDLSSDGSFKECILSKRKKLANIKGKKIMSLALDLHLTNTRRVCPDFERF